MAERGSVQRREFSSALLSGLGQWSTGLPPDGYGENYGIPEILIQGHDIPSARGALFEPPPLPVQTGGGGSETLYYKMRGYYVTGSVYETWIATDTPNNTPPSGHTLTGVVVVSVTRV